MFNRRKKQAGDQADSEAIPSNAPVPEERERSGSTAAKPSSKLKNFLAHNADCDPDCTVLLMHGTSTDHTEFTNALSKGVAMGRIGNLYMSNDRLWFDGGLFNKLLSGSRTLPFSYIASISKAATGLAKINNAIDIHIKEDCECPNEKWGWKPGQTLTFSWMKGRDEWYNYLDIMVQGFRSGQEADQRSAQESVLLQKMIKKASGGGHSKHISYSIGSRQLDNASSSKKDEKSTAGPGEDADPSTISVAVSPHRDVARGSGGGSMTPQAAPPSRPKSAHRRVFSDSGLPSIEKPPSIASDDEGNGSRGDLDSGDHASPHHSRKRSASLKDIMNTPPPGHADDETASAVTSEPQELPQVSGDDEEDGSSVVVKPSPVVSAGPVDDSEPSEDVDTLISSKTAGIDVDSAVQTRSPKETPPSSPARVNKSPSPVKRAISTPSTPATNEELRRPSKTSDSSSVIPPRTTKVMSVDELSALRSKPGRGVIASALNLDYDESPVVGNFKPTDFAVFVLVVLIIDLLVWYVPLVRLIYIVAFNYVFFRWVNRQQMHTDRIGQLNRMLARFRSPSKGGKQS